MQIYKFLFRQKDGESMKPRKKCGTETLSEPAQRHVAVLKNLIWMRTKIYWVLLNSFYVILLAEKQHGIPKYIWEKTTLLLQQNLNCVIG